MKVMTTTALIALGGVIASAETSQAQSACETYQVKRGDSLSKIAIKAYGFNNFRAIYDSNTDVIGKDPSIVMVNTWLYLPCADGSLPGAETDGVTELESTIDINVLAKIETPVETDVVTEIKLAPKSGADKTDADSVADIEVAGIDDDPKIFSFVTANGYLPYTDESLAGQGMFTALVERAMLRADPQQVYTVTFINDRASHLEALLPSLAFDASFPWTRPGCETQKDLSAVEFYSCHNYVYSDTFYEIVDGFFARTGSAYDGAIYYSDLAGATICRPEGYSTSHLAEINLLPPVVKLSQPVRVTDCFEFLMDGSVDLIALDTRAGAKAITALSLEGQVSENPVLSSISPLQVAVHTENPNAEGLIEILNTGLREMQHSGEWRDMISKSLQSEVQTRAGSVMN